MGNKNYEKGRRKEYKLKRELERAGWLVLRTAGSHGFADLVAIKGTTIRFIQCKPDDFPESRQKKLMEEHKFFNQPYKWKTTFEVI